MTDTRFGLAVTADWLAVQFLTPPGADRVTALCSDEGQAVLTQIGDEIGCPSAMRHVKDAMSSQDETDMCAALQQRYVMLFEGVSRRHYLPPYASLWDGTGRLCGPATGRMQRILRALDVHVAQNGNQPTDHLGIQLAALAEALRQRRDDMAEYLLDELTWVDRFGPALIQADGAGFYAGLAHLLSAFLDTVALDCGRDRPRILATV